jgi:serine/threonine protein kinase
MANKYIDNGTYGCVFKPSFPCNSSKKYDGTISKIFYSKIEANKEYNESSVISNINTKNEFTIKPIDKCIINKNKINTSELSKCGIKWQNDNDFVNIIYLDGGESLSRINIGDEKTLLKILYNFTHILKGLQKLDKTGFAHLDIKPANIVYNRQTNRLYLIDFGLLKKTNDIYNNNENMYILQHPYDYYPPEFQIFSHSNEIKKNKIMMKYYLDINTSYIKDNLWKSANKSFGYNNDKFKIDDSILQILNLSKGSITNLFSKKIDIYGLSISMLMLIVNSPITYFSNKKLFKKILDWISNASNPNPFYRYDINQSLKEWYNIIEEFPKDTKNILSPQENVIIVKKSPKKTNKLIKKCPEDKILNPKTNICVKRDGKIGKSLIKKSSIVKKCPEDKILNPKTNRCVKKDGKIGKSLFKNKI